MKTTLLAISLLVFSSSLAAASSSEGAGDGEVNPCNPKALTFPPISEALNVPIACSDAGAKVQSGADVTFGSKGTMKASLMPIATPLSEVEGMCAVNVHWHLGAEHRNKGTYDIPGADWVTQHGDDASFPQGIEAGNFCPGFDAKDPKFTTAYKFEHCTDMKVGYTYEMHWPNSNLGMCGSEWQYQTPFMNGVLCKATAGNLTPGDAVASVFDAKSTKIGVQGQIFTIVNDPAYDYPDWDALKGWNTALAEDVAVYQGSTTGLKDGNKVCTRSGGMVSWQVDRGCHLISAKAFDNLCKIMKQQKSDMSADTRPRNARKTTAPAITTNVAMGRK
jgi:hypothetical protein